MNRLNIDLDEFSRTGFHLKKHLAAYLEISLDELDNHLSAGLKNMAALHPSSFNAEDLSGFYEFEVGTAHLLELSAWHLASENYIADTLRLQNMFARGRVLDFGGGIGTHAIAAAALPSVDHVYFVDLNPQNRSFVEERAKKLGLSEMISFYRDLEGTGDVKFDTIVCLDVLEHLTDPSFHLLSFLERLSSQSAVALLNWYFFKGNNGEYPFHIDDKKIINKFFLTLQKNFVEVFHPFLITTRAYNPIKLN